MVAAMLLGSECAPDRPPGQPHGRIPRPFKRGTPAYLSQHAV